MENNRLGYIVVTDYLPADGITDVSDSLQSLIDANPNRTLFFPDGAYLLSKPVLTPAHPKRSVDLQFANFARLQAADDWSSDEAMVRLGAKDPANDICTPGSNYGISGGIIDGGGRAKAISIDGGRETYIRGTNIKNAFVAIHIKHGANNGSSDADISGVNITGNGSPDSIGVLLEGYDNTLTNMRIADVRNHRHVGPHQSAKILDLSEVIHAGFNDCRLVSRIQPEHGQRRTDVIVEILRRFQHL